MLEKHRSAAAAALIGKTVRELRDVLVERHIVVEDAEYTNRKIRNEELEPDEWAAMVRLFVEDKPEITADEIRELLRVPCNSRGHSVQFVDKYFRYWDLKRCRREVSVDQVQRFWIDNGVVWFQNDRRHCTNLMPNSLFIHSSRLARELIQRMINNDLVGEPCSK